VGEAGMGMYNGANFASRSNVIFVSINYRLGLMGWFTHPALKHGDPLDDSGNYGTLDIIKALTWVQENISSFGGDPDNVTIAGESAGSYNVYSLMLSPLAKGLFHQAIAESAPPMTIPVEKGQESAQEVLVGLLIEDFEEIESPEDAEDFILRKGYDWVADYLRSKSTEDIYSILGGGILDLFSPFEDGTVIPENGWSSLIKGNYNKVPIILGCNKEEIKLFLPFIISDLGNEEMYELIVNFDPDNPDIDFLDILTLGNISPLWILLYEPVASVGSGLFEAIAVDTVASILVRHQDSVYAYEFAWDEEPEPFNLLIGAAHAIEIPFIFANFDTSTDSNLRFAWSQKNRPGRKMLSDAMMTYWCQFIYTGNPNSPDLPVWDIWCNEPEGPKRIILDTGISMSSQALNAGVLRNKWDELDTKPSLREKLEPLLELPLY
ncbi:MAG: carboxylesterase family protein, partial [Deltaproteobacteria bacterium]|nr:carboxylesterase family protein [Deltaproteobacteria bacterium]